MELHPVVSCDRCRRPVLGTHQVDEGVAAALHHHLREHHYLAIAAPRDAASFRAVMRHFSLRATHERPLVPILAPAAAPSIEPEARRTAA
jgi:hypothetical protein